MANSHCKPQINTDYTDLRQHLCKFVKSESTVIIKIAYFLDDETYFVCYYIDGNTKALWSSNRCYKGRVTMPGSRHELSRKRIYS